MEKKKEGVSGSVFNVPVCSYLLCALRFAAGFSIDHGRCTMDDGQLTINN